MFGIKARKQYRETRGMIGPGVLVEHADPLAEAAKLAARRKGPSRDEVSSELSRLTALKRSMLKVEVENNPEIPARIEELRCLMLDFDFDRIDLSFLRWRRKDLTPVFAFFSPFEDPICSIGYDPSVWSLRAGEVMEPKIDDLKPFFRDVYDRFRANCEYRARGTLAAFFDMGSHESEGITARFKGIIPAEVRGRINSAKAGDQFHNVIIVSEAEWGVMAPRKLDPLVLGLRGPFAWLIDKFDLTPAERIVASEFTT